MTFCGGLGIGHLQALESIQDDCGHNQTGVLLVVGGHDIPGRFMSAGCIEALFKRLHVFAPVLPLVDVCRAELPVLVGLFDARKKSFALLVLGDVEEYLYGAG